MVTVQFKVGQNQEDSLVKLYNQLMQNMDRLPAGAEQPIVRPINVDDVPILTLTLSSATQDESALREVGARMLEQLRNVEGVSFTQMLGGRAPALNVWLDPQRMEARGLSLARVDQALRGANVSAPLGMLTQGGRARSLRLDGFLGNADTVGNVVIGASNGRPVYLRDIARIETGGADVEEGSWIGFGPAAKVAQAGATPAVTLAIAKKAGTNGVSVSRAVLDKLDELKRQALPHDIRITVTRDDGERADAAVNLLV